MSVASASTQPTRKHIRFVERIGSLRIYGVERRVSLIEDGLVLEDGVIATIYRRNSAMSINVDKLVSKWGIKALSEQYINVMMELSETAWMWATSADTLYPDHTSWLFGHKTLVAGAAVWARGKSYVAIGRANYDDLSISTALTGVTLSEPESAFRLIQPLGAAVIEYRKKPSRVLMPNGAVIEVPKELYVVGSLTEDIVLAEKYVNNKRWELYAIRSDGEMDRVMEFESQNISVQIVPNGSSSYTIIVRDSMFSMPNMMWLCTLRDCQAIDPDDIRRAVRGYKLVNIDRIAPIGKHHIVALVTMAPVDAMSDLFGSFEHYTRLLVLDVVNHELLYITRVPGDVEIVSCPRGATVSTHNASLVIERC